MGTIACKTFLVAGSDEREAVSGHACNASNTVSLLPVGSFRLSHF